MVFQPKVRQVWECKWCKTRHEQSLPCIEVYCKKGHRMKLIEGEKLAPKSKLKKPKK